MNRTCLSLFITLWGLPLFVVSQNKLLKKISIGITKEFETHVSYTSKGISKGIGLSFKKARQQLGLGLVFLPTNYPVKNLLPLGFYTDYRYYTRSYKSIQPFLNSYYSNHLLNTQAVNSEGTPTTSLQNQVFVGYGISVKLGHFRITNSVTYGSYIEVKKDLYSNRKSALIHMSHQFKMTVAYDF